MKYVGGLQESIWKKLKFFKVEDIDEASVKAMRIKEKNQPKDKKKGDKFKKGHWKI